MILRRYEVLGSTNDEAFRLAHDGAAHGTVVTARQQTAGRGRQGRSWISPPGNLLVSFLFRSSGFPGFTASRGAELGFVAAVAVADTIAALTGGCQLKWPNDVLLDGAKTAGILTEMAGDAIVVGIGINVAHSPAHMPYAVTSLAAAGAAADAETVLAVLMDRMDNRIAEWAAQGFDAIRVAWLLRGPSIGQVMTARCGGGWLDGQFAGLAGDGALLLQTRDGIQRIVAGEVLQA